MLHREIIQLEEGWEKMKKGIDKLITILEQRKDSFFTAEEYMTLYTTTYNMCTQRAPNDYSEQLYARYQQAFKDYLTNVVLVRIVEQDTNVKLLKELSQAWKNHAIMVRWLTRFFNYLDRYYIVRHNLPNLNQVALLCFRDIIFEAKHEAATDALLELIAREREHEAIDRDLVKTVLSIFIDVGLDSTEVYHERFEKQLLQDLHRFYSQRAALWIQDDSAPEFLIKAEACLQEEEDRADNYLHTESKKSVVEAVQAELLVAPQAQLIEKDSGMAAMLRDGKATDLARLFSLYHRCGADAIAPLALIFQRHIRSEGMALVDAVTAATAAAGTGGDAGSSVGDRAAASATAAKKDAATAETTFIRRVLELQDKYLAVVEECFQAHSSMHKALKDAFEVFCNKSVAGSTTPELMANFCDLLLSRRGPEKLSDDDIDRQLEKIVRLLVYINERDMFSEFHRKKLGKRLLNQSADQQEHAFLQRLKAQCGSTFTQKMEGMLNDLTVAREKQAEFNKWAEDKGKELPAELDVKVLTTGFWPSYSPTDVVLPKAAADCVEAFQEFYRDTTKNRNLTWIHQLGNMVVKAPFKAKAKELQVVPTQAAVLLLFNDVDELTYTEIADRTQLSEEELMRALNSLTTSRYAILRRAEDEGGGGGGSAAAGRKSGKAARLRKVTKSDTFLVNWEFTDKLFRIRVPMPHKEDKSKVVEEVQKDRKFAIDAAIVRIMKSRKVLEHNQLVVEVMQQVKKMFTADQKSIKKRLEDLISREYLERDRDNATLYRYLA